MKELSIEEKAQRYDEAIEKAKVFKEHLLEIDEKDYADEMDYIFPELKESEDERIKTFIRGLLLPHIADVHLEGDKLVHNKDIDNYRKALAWLEKQGEQKSIDKVEPKFKVGDWVVVDGVTQQVTQIQPEGFDTDRAWNGKLTFKDVHLWTIQDAKDGDVLAYVTGEGNLWIMIYWSLYKPYEGHVHYHALLVDDNFTDKGTCFICIDNLKPATKEQRDTLFAKMKEAGYEWNAEKKKLKKIEQNTEWSEEDEKMLDIILNDINYAQKNFSVSKLTPYDKKVDWLKSLRPQSTWKPSDLPHWKKSNLPNNSTTGFNSDYFCHKGYCINYKDLFEKLPKDE